MSGSDRLRPAALAALTAITGVGAHTHAAMAGGAGIHAAALAPVVGVALLVATIALALPRRRGTTLLLLGAGQLLTHLAQLPSTTTSSSGMAMDHHTAMAPGMATGAHAMPIPMPMAHPSMLHHLMGMEARMACYHLAAVGLSALVMVLGGRLLAAAGEWLGRLPRIPEPLTLPVVAALVATRAPVRGTPRRTCWNPTSRRGPPSAGLASAYVMDCATA